MKLHDKITNGMKTIAGPTIHQERLESFNQDCLDLFKDLSVDSLISRILYIAATWTNSCYCVCGLTSSRRGRFSSYKLYGFTPSEIKLLNAGQKDAILSIPSDEIICTLKHSVTVVPAKGMFSGKETEMLICVVQKHQVVAMEKIIAAHPGAFAYSTVINETLGNYEKIRYNVFDHLKKK